MGGLPSQGGGGPKDLRHVKVHGHVHTSISGDIVQISGQAVVTDSGSVTSVSGNVVQISGQQIDISGQPVTISGNIVQISGQAVVTDSGSVTSVSGNVVQVVNLSGQTLSVNISGQPVTISGQPVTISGQPVTISGNKVSVNTVSGDYVVISGTVSISPPTTVRTINLKTVTGTSGGVVLGSGVITACILKAWSANVANIWVGGSISPFANSGVGMFLAANDSIAMDTSNFNNIFVFAETSGEKVATIGIN